MSYRAQLQFGRVNLGQLTEDQVRVGFILRLPFRLRVGKLRRFKCDWQGPFEVCFRNALDIPNGTDTSEVLRQLQGSYEALWTDALTIVEEPRVQESDLEALRKSEESPEPSPTNLTGNAFQAIKALNQLIIAYSTATKDLWGGRPLRTLSDIEFFERLRWEITILCPKAHVLREADILQLFNLRPDREFISLGQLTGDLDDLSEEELAGIGGMLIRQQEFVFYEFAFQAKSKMVERDFVGAVLMAVVALEAAHAAFVRHALSQRLERLKKARTAEAKLVNNFLREQGLYTLYQMTPFLLMEEGERPSPEVLRACGQGIQMRNDIMHALTNAKGQYKVRQHVPMKISEAYSAILEVYDCYVRALESRLDHGS
jgi:hypothetical protein